jgi:hypothetical protein
MDQAPGATLEKFGSRMDTISGAVDKVPYDSRVRGQNLS